MVAIKSYEADRFLARLPPQVFLYLVFGTDAGLVAERVRHIIGASVENPKDPFQFLRLSGDDLAADPARLADEAHTIPLFGGRRAIHIDAQGKSFIAAIEPILAVPPQDCTIVVEAGALKKDSALRKLCEREKNAAAIECYPDSAKDLARLISATASGSGLSIAPDALEYLETLLGEDRLSTRLELEKLVLYTHGEREIRVEHVEAIVSDASQRIIDQPVDAAFAGDFEALEEGATRALGDPSDVNLLLAAALRHALALYRGRLSLEARSPGAEGTARPGPGSFRRSATFEQHLRSWTAERLMQAIVAVGEAVAATRREPKLGRAIAMRALWKVASWARAGRATKGAFDG